MKLKTLALLCFLAVPSLAAIVDIPLRNNTGAAYTNQPQSVFMTFKCGDVANYPRPVLDGVVMTSWQTNVRTRWSTTGCADNSVQQVMFSFLVTIPANSTVHLNFQNDANPCHLGNQATCDAAGLSIAAIQAFNETSGGAANGWNTQIEAVASGITKTFNPRTILNSCGSISADPNTLGCRFWITGPIRDAVILEDRDTTLLYDAGFACSPCSYPYSGTTWTSDTTDKPLHPEFVVEFWHGTTFIEFSTIALENMKSTHFKDQAYALTIKTGGPLTNVAYTKAYFTHFGLNRWRKRFWNGTAPGTVQVDQNLAYLISTGVFPNYDLTKTPNVTGDNTAWAASDGCDINGRGRFTKQIGDTGGREEISIIPGQYVRALFTWDATAIHNMQLQSDCWGSMQVNVRETGPGFYDAAHTVTAFGRSFSVDNHPASRIQNLTAVGSYTTGQTGYTGYQLSHIGDFSFVPYMTSGDWFTYESLVLQVASDIENTDPTNLAYGRNGAMGIINGRAQQTRGQAWGWRDLIHGLFAMLDGSPEKAYFLQKLGNNIGVFEGYHNIPDGAYFNAATTSPWYWGRNTMAVGFPNPLRFPNWPDQDGQLTGWVDATKVQYIDSPLEFRFLTMAIGRMVEMGYPFSKYQQVDAANQINMTLNPSYNPYLLAAYRVPEFLKTNLGHFATTWASVLGAYSTSPTNYQTIATWPANDAGDCVGGYPQYSRAALAYTANITLLPADGSYSGGTAYNWINDPLRNVSTQGCLNANPMWAINKRGAAAPVPPTITQTCPLPTATQNVAYNQTMQAVGDPTIAWTIGTGSLPTGLSLASGGALTGTPTVLGTSTFSLVATSSTLPAATKAGCTLAVVAAPVIPTITTSTLPAGTVNVLYAQPLASTGDVPQTFAITSGTLPVGITLDSASGIIGGTTAVAGNYSFSVTATNAAGSSTPKALTMAVAGASGISVISIIVNGKTVVQGTGVITVTP